MKKQYVIIISCIVALLFVFTPLNILATSQEFPQTSEYDISYPLENKNEYLDFEGAVGDPPYLPFPGEIIDNAPMFQNFSIPERESFHHDISVQFQDDSIIEILLKLNESLYLEYLEDLVDFGPRVTGSSACEQAGEYIYSQFESMGLQVRYHYWSYGGYSGKNIEGTLEGINESSDEIYIISAHYDSVTGSPGADDDGSGTAAVLAAADLISKYDTNHTVRFVAFSGEEQGLLGSHEYAAEAYANGDNIIGVLNGDMIGFALTASDGNNIRIYENSESHWITEITYEISNLYEEYIELNIVPSGFSGGSDHYSFWQIGYNAILYHEYNFNDFYHSPQDIIENMNISYAIKSSKLMVSTLATLAQSMIPSKPPNQPIITGPTTGLEGEEYEYIFTTIDPEGNDVYYYIEWGDNTNSSWLGPYNSGESGEAFHKWSEPGDYNIRVQAMDIYGKVSNWSTPISIHILYPPLLDITRIIGGLFKADVIIQNRGEINATNVSWTISFDGGAFIGKETSGITTVSAGKGISIYSNLILGFGPTRIKVKVSTPESSDVYEIGGYVLLFYLKVNPGGGF